jgi:hypothetical protein
MLLLLQLGTGLRSTYILENALKNLDIGYYILK